MRKTKITIKGKPKEIAELTAALKTRRNKETDDIFQKQLELLSKASQGALDENLPGLTCAMVDLSQHL